jgi:HD-GYP domain-containing protein (c-di-GMP phosphodiesterase class II)
MSDKTKLEPRPKLRVWPTPPDDLQAERVSSAMRYPTLHLTASEPRQPTDAGELRSIADRLESLASANAELSRELTRCTAHLGMLVEFDRDVSELRDADAMQDVLLRRVADLLDAAIYTTDPSGVLRGASPTDAAELPTPSLLADWLAPELLAVRSAVRAGCQLAPSAARAGLAANHALVGVLDGAARPCVVLAVRGRLQPAFDAADRLAAESLLLHGGYLIRSTAIMRKLERSAVETVAALANVIDARDPYTRGHSERVGLLAGCIARQLGQSNEQARDMEWAGLLHDVGKIGVAERILNKAGPLTQVETEQVQQHPRLSYEVIRPVTCLQPVLGAVLHHHENFDGSGYPDALAGECIPIGARILRVADTFDAMTSDRAYREGMNFGKALQTIRDGAGREFDPAVTAAFFVALDSLARDRTELFLERFAHVPGVADPGPTALQNEVEP